PVRYSAPSQALRRSGEGGTAKQADLRLLVWSEGQCGFKVGNAASHQTAVVAPGEGHVRFDLLQLMELVLQMSGLLKRLVMVNAEDALRQGPVKVPDPP